MVDIQEIPDDPPVDEGQPSDPATDDGTETTDDGWQKLMGDDLLMMVTETKEPLSTPANGNDIQPQDAVLIDFVGRIAADRSVTDGPIFQQVKGWLVVIGDGDILPALEMACRFMKAGQTAKVWSHSKYAMGPGTRTQPDSKLTVPPHSSVMYEVTVAQKVMDTSRLNPYFTIQKALTKKNIANDIYQYEWCPPPKQPTTTTNNDDPNSAPAMSRAIRLYQKAAKEMETLLNGTYFQQVEKDHPQRGQSQQILLDSLNNIVAVYLRQKEYHKAKQSAIEVLKQDSKNLKGLLRAAKSSLLDPASTLEEVKAALTAAESEITYKNPKEEKELKKLKVEFKKFQAEYKKQTKAMFTGKLHNNTLGGGDDDGDDDNKGDSSQKKAVGGKSEKEDATTTTSREAPQTTTDAAGTEEGKEAAPSQATKDDDDATFWKSQIFTIIVQIVIPMALFFVYRMFTKTDKIARGILVVEDAIHANDAMEGQQPVVEPEEIINLDL